MVLAVNILYAGDVDIQNKDWGKGLWPQEGSLEDFEVDGVRINRYQISNIGSLRLEIGTFVHESCHLLFDYPDLYDTDIVSDSQGVGKYCVMGARTDP
jgi:M6 family metalloprotease-like protein